jgi:AcrR family transcriptional regulator
LHQTVGAQGATISALAQQAGVERLTVYRHFPDERSLVSACTRHYFAHHPPPDTEQWRAIVEPELCLRTALAQIYIYYRQTEAMMDSIYRNIAFVPLLQELLEPFFAKWNAVTDMLVEKFAVDSEQRSRLRPVVALAIHFLTWRTLIREQRLEDAQAVEVMVASIVCMTKQC